MRRSGLLRPRRRRMLDDLLVIAVIGAASAVAWRMVSPPDYRVTLRAGGATSEPMLPSEPVSLKGLAVDGSREAGLVLLEVADFQCPYCAKFASEALPVIRERYVKAGTVQLAFLHFPMETIRPLAFKAAEVAECAGAQGSFWAMNQLLFQRRQEFAEARWNEYASSTGLDLDEFRSCLSGQVTARIRDQVATGQSLGVSVTPTFFVGIRMPDLRIRLVRRITGAQPLAIFEEALDALLQQRPLLQAR